MKTFLAQNKFNSDVHVPETSGSAAAIACPQPRAAAAPVSDGVGAKPILASSPSEAATVSGREPVAATLISNSGAPQPRGEPAQTDATQPAGSPNISTTLSHNKITQAVEIQSSCGSDVSRVAVVFSPAGSDWPTVKMAGCDQSGNREAGLAPGPQDHINELVDEPDFEDELEQLIGVAGQRRRRPLALPAFAPDFPALWKAMHDKTAPRTVLDPLWADASPLFLSNVR